jgi:hypothetical protein
MEGTGGGRKQEGRTRPKSQTKDAAPIFDEELPAARAPPKHAHESPLAGCRKQVVAKHHARACCTQKQCDKPNVPADWTLVWLRWSKERKPQHASSINTAILITSMRQLVARLRTPAASCAHSCRVQGTELLLFVLIAALAKLPHAGFFE